MGREVQIFLCAVQFLTRLPTPALKGFEPDWTTRSARYFPVVGQIIGAISAGVLVLGSMVWDRPLAAIVAVAVGVLVTGAFHEDGLADTADGLAGGADPVRRLEIMKDSRIGTFGALALGLVVAVKIAALASLPPMSAAVGLLAAHGGARAAAVVAMRCLPHASLAEATKWTPATKGVSRGEVFVAILSAAWPFCLMSPGAAALSLLPACAAALIMAMAARRLVGGYTGDILGAVEQLFEAFLLLGVAAATTLNA